MSKVSCQWPVISGACGRAKARPYNANSDFGIRLVGKPKAGIANEWEGNRHGYCL